MKRLILTLTAFLAVLGMLYAQEADAVYTTQGKNFGAVTEQYLDDCIKYSIGQDIDQIKDMIATKKIFKLKEGLEIHIMEISGNKIRCQVVGTDVEFWTVKQELQ